MPRNSSPRKLRDMDTRIASRPNPRAFSRTFGAIAILLLAAVAGTAPTAHAAVAIPADVHEFVDSELERNGVPGAALAIADRNGIAVETFGSTGRDDQPVVAATPFLIGSVTKSFTAVAALQLAERGKLDLDAPVRDYLPWFSVEPDGDLDRVTVRTLLNQTSGIPTDAGGGAMRYLDDVPIATAARELDGVELAAPPGTRFEYANGNYVLLGALIEVASGLSYGDYLQANVFDPLAMTSTFTAIAPARSAGMSEGHRYWLGFTRPHVTFTDALLPAGGVISSAPDVARYAQMLLNGGAVDGERLLSRASVATMQTPAVDATVGPWAKDPHVSYGMGLYVGGAPFGPENASFHPGGSPDFGSMLVLLPEQKQTLVLLYNATPEVAMPGAAGALDRIGAGATSLLIGSAPADGPSMHGYYLAFDLLVAAVLAALIWALVRAIRRPPGAPPSRLRGVLRVGRALLALLVGALLLLFPLLSGLGWKVMFLSVPDHALVAIVFGLLLCTIGTVRLVRLGRRRFSFPTDGEGRSPGERPAAPATAA